MNSKKLDLNLLLVFDALSRTGSVSSAAQKLGLSQPAVSHAINRLRDVTGDQLFVRSRRGMIATPRAVEMKTEVANVLASAERVFADQRFVPEQSSRSFRIGASDYSMLTIVPALVQHLRHVAPNIKLDIVQVNEGSLAALEDGILDVSFWGAAAPSKPFNHLVLFKDRYVGAMSAQHPLCKGKRMVRVTMAQYLSFPHVVVSLRDPGKNAVDQALAKLRLSRQVVFASQSFIGNLQCVHMSDLITTVPSRLCADKIIQGLVTFQLPFSVPEIEYSVVWHKRVDADPTVAWLVQCIAHLNVRSTRGHSPFE